ncbi:hypothetical protein HWV62_1520 [Athelia sp. TMB]|nr:hypothetical protein HWV62_23148 [Athelia sp. TMB]KAF7978108.1 hypothetical protein HWV62_1520 [Athelia sp. TMB]
MLQTLRPNTMIQEITHDPITPVSTRQLDLQDTSKRVKQPYDVLLVLDVEATCLENAGFHWPNEVVEWPVCLMRWKDMTNGRASILEVADEFRSFVKPTWAPVLSPFCTSLTGITQAQVDNAPTFPVVLQMFEKFLIKNGLIDAVTGNRLVNFCWCSDGPFDVQNFVVKQCFISKISMPEWLRGDVIDVRKQVIFWSEGQPSSYRRTPRPKPGERRQSLGIPLQLHALGLSSFEGRQHSGIDDTRNIARILAELARRGVSLQANCVIDPRRRWHWMGKRAGEILEHTLAYPE